MARKVKTRQQNVPIPTIIGAGITEQWYFTHLQRIFGYRVKVRPRFFGQEDIFQLTKKVESVIQDGGVAIAVFDADVASWDRKERMKLDAFRKKYAKNENVIICDSLPSIEYWFLLHFADIHRFFPTSQSVCKELVKFLDGYDKNEEYLCRENWVRQLCESKNMSIATERAKMCGENQSYTNIPLAFAAIAKQ